MFGGSTHVFLVIDRPTGYIRDAPAFDEKNAPSGTLEKKATGEKFTAPQQKSEVTDEFFFMKHGNSRNPNQSCLSL